jgi:hypothetical protein
MPALVRQGRKLTNFKNMTNIQVVINFVYFTTNFTGDFIEKVWGDNTHLSRHLTEKFLGHMEPNGVVTAGSFIRFFQELSLNNQEKLVAWINENYNGMNF